MSLLVACQDQERSPIETRLFNTDKDAIGTATFNELEDKVSVHIKAEGLTPGFHGVHIHEYAKCEGPDFESAGNHFNPEGKEHGLMHPDGAHLGDMPNLEADSDGTVDVELELPGATLMEGNNSLLREDGTSIIIHENEDDGVTQPGGNSGDRIACGVISMADQDKEEPTDPTETNDDEEKKEE
nr:superoxide dismutase family protein [Gracilibacillus alcaliphilus]